ncbi:hypothetical protein J1N35_011056 [Gossypium stocksii]|uniref:Uncharacterized protein n=1 Tax=Gossypium stocksii TaxID=47602 RepID=A0A9D3W2T9_9ROSI|nr:hypothetical protein J1N35_011056 [Gossypium stocksii]
MNIVSNSTVNVSAAINVISNNIDVLVVSSAATNYANNVNVVLVIAPISILSINFYTKPFLDISKIEAFDENQFKIWQEHIFSFLDMHGVALTLTEKQSLDPIDKKLDLRIRVNKCCDNNPLVSQYHLNRS